MNILKTEHVAKNKWRVLAIPYGGPIEGRDLDGEFFSPRTDIKPDWFDRRPLVWHHNLDRTMKADAVIGTADDLEASDEGWWITAWLDRSHQYFAQLDQLLRAGKVYGSSGSLPHFVRTDTKTGEILIWPYIEQTFTPTPSNILSRVVPAKAVDHFDGAGISLAPAVRGLLTDLDSPTADLRGDLPDDLRATVAAQAADHAAIQRLVRDPDRTRVVRHLASLAPRLEQLKNR